MPVFVDASVLVSAAVVREDSHEASLEWLQRALARTSLVTSTHALAEVYNTLTGRYRVPASSAIQILARYRRHITVTALSDRDYDEALQSAAKRHIVGPSIYDYLHGEAVRKAGAERVATLNTRHFVRFWARSRLIDPTGRAIPDLG